MKKIFGLFKPYIWMIIILAIFTYLQVLTNLELPDYMSKIINDGIMKKDNNSIYSNGGLMLIVTLAGAACTIIVGFFAAKVATGFTRDLRRDVFKKIESFSIVEFNKFSASSLITRSTNDIQQIQMATFMTFRLFLMAPMMAVGAIQNALHTAPGMSWIIVAASVLMVLLVGLLFGFGFPKFKILQQLVDKLNLVVRENLTGLRVVRAFNNEKIEEAKFKKANSDLTKLNLFVNRLMALMQPAMTLIMNMAIIAIVWFGAHLVDEGSIQIGNMMAFMQYAMQVIMSFLMISIIFIIIPRASVSLKRIKDVIDTEEMITSPAKPVKVTKNNSGRIEFKNVNFVYENAQEAALSGIDFVAEPNQTTAIIGSTGSGKTTLVNLIPRLYDATSGQILIDGVDVRDYDLEKLRDIIGYVPQKASLFSGTVETNIKYGNKKFSDDEMEQIAKVAHANEFIDNLDKKYQDHIAQGGANVSGGQKQRLAIARALAKKPLIYVFDDSFSALDFKTDAGVRKELVKETKNKTVLIIGQRISTIMNADKIIVMNEGKIVGQGTHQELLNNCKVYQEIAKSQLSDRELKNIEARKGDK